MSGRNAIARSARRASIVLGFALLLLLACSASACAPSAQPGSRRPPALASAPRAVELGLAAAGDSTCAWSEAGDVTCWGGAFSPPNGGFTRATIPELRALAVDDAIVCGVDARGAIACFGPAVGATPRRIAWPPLRHAGASIAFASQRLEERAGFAPHLCVASEEEPVCFDPLAERPALRHVRYADRVPFGPADRVWPGAVPCFGGPGGKMGCDDPLVPIDEPGAQALAATEDATCILAADGGIRCGGRGAAGLGQLGPIEGVQAVALAAGQRHTCAIDRAGSVWCWGEGGNGRLGDGGTELRLDAARVAGLPGPAIAIALGARHSCARVADRGVFCWGDDTRGQLDAGLRRTLNAELIGVVALPPDLGFCGWRGDGSVLCWGDRGLPKVREDLVNVTAIVPERGGACALDRDHHVWCWEWHGDAVVVPELSDALELVPLASCARRRHGALACWGRNDAGQIGDGTTVHPKGWATPRGLLAGAKLGDGSQQRFALGDGKLLVWGELAWERRWTDRPPSHVPSLWMPTWKTTSRLQTTPIRTTDFGDVAESSSRAKCFRRTDGTVAISTRACRATSPSSWVCRIVASVAPKLDDAESIVADADDRCLVRRRGGELAIVREPPRADESFYLDTTTAPPETRPVAKTWSVAVRFAAAEPHEDGWGASALLPDGTVLSGDLGAEPHAIEGAGPAIELARSAGEACSIVRGGGLRCWGKAESRASNPLVATSLSPLPIDLTRDPVRRPRP